MAKIVDPDNLKLTLTGGSQSDEEVIIDTSAKTLALTDAGTSDLDDDGVTGKCFYSFLKEEWRSNATLAKHPFPLEMIDGPNAESMELLYPWTWADADSPMFIRDCGFAVKDAVGVSTEEWMGVVSLGSFNAGTDQANYQQVDGGNPVDFHLPGEVNECVKIYGDASHGDFDYRDYFVARLRVEAKTYEEYDLVTEQNLTALTYKKYQIPLANEADSVNVTHADSAIASDAPYTGITITWHASPVERTIAGVAREFNIIIDGNAATLKQIYEKVQYQLRQTGDIDAGAGTERGDITDSLLTFIGADLYCSTGVYIDDFQATETNNLHPRDTGGVIRDFPYVSAGEIRFGVNLSGDAAAKYWIFFTNDDAGDNAGYDFGTDDAILIKDASGDDLTGDVDSNSTITFDYDFDGNVQRGNDSAGEDVPYTAVALGLTTGKYYRTTGTLTRSKANVITLAAEKERSFENPA
jgi:hypothetical protein